MPTANDANGFSNHRELMKNTFELNHWIKTHGDLALDMVRIYLGIGLMVKAVFFMTHGDYLEEMLDSMGGAWFAPAALMQYIILAHLVGGLCLTIGLITRAAAVVQLPILLGALFYVHLPKMMASVESRQSLEFTGLVLFILALISVYGAGRWSLDYALGRKDNAALFRTPVERPKAAGGGRGEGGIPIHNQETSNIEHRTLNAERGRGKLVEFFLW